MMQSGQKIKVALKDSRQIYALIMWQVVVEDNKKQFIAQLEAVQLKLVEFKDIKPNELLDGLPLMMDIQHHIDRLSRASC